MSQAVTFHATNYSVIWPKTPEGIMIPPSFTFHYAKHHECTSKAINLAQHNAIKTNAVGS